jgi:hypothetical protein
MRTHTKINHKTKRRLLSLLLAIILAIPTISVAIPTTASAAVQKTYIKLVDSKGNVKQAKTSGYVTVNKKEFYLTMYNSKQKYTAYVKGKDDVRLRLYPSANTTAVVNKIAYGMPVKVLGVAKSGNNKIRTGDENKSKNWVYVSYKGQTKTNYGFIRSDYITTSKDTAVRIVHDTSYKGTTMYTATASTKIYTYPTTSAKVLDKYTDVNNSSTTITLKGYDIKLLAKGKVKRYRSVSSSKKNGTWYHCQYTYKNKTYEGYVHSSDLTSTKPSSSSSGNSRNDRDTLDLNINTGEDHSNAKNK